MEKITGTGPSPEQVLAFKIKRVITTLFKSHLELIEDLTVEHDAALNKLDENLPAQYKPYVDLANHMTEEKCEQLRKRILDKGNSSYKEIEELLKQFNIDYK